VQSPKAERTDSKSQKLDSKGFRIGALTWLHHRGKRRRRRRRGHINIIIANKQQRRPRSSFLLTQPHIEPPHRMKQRQTGQGVSCFFPPR
jgi:hypothetical protein